MSGPETDLARLSAAARRGTSRTGLPEVTSTPLGEALKWVERDAPEAALLARAALAGLHAQAGRTPAVPTLPAPRFEPAEEPEPGISPALEALLPALAEQPEVLREALTRLYPTGKRLNAVQARPLLILTEGGGDPLGGSLWPVLNEHARWLARLHPAWKRQDPATPSAAVGLARLRRELVEAHAADPAGCATDLLARWPILKADERRVALGAAAGSLTVADWPLLQMAMTDKLPDVRRWARLLQGHLPGEVQDAVRTNLPTWFKREKGKLKVVKGQYVEALGETDPKTTADNELGRLLGASPISDLPGLLGHPLPEIRVAVSKFSEHVGSPQQVYRGQSVIEDMERGAVAGADLETLLAFSSDLPGLLEFWPQSRVRNLLWQAVARLNRAEPETGPLRLALILFAALDGPLPLTPDEPPAAQKKGLLARVASALGVGAAEPQNWPTHLHSLAERLLLALSREVSSYPLPLVPLLEALLPHLDLTRPDPTFPEAQLSDRVPEGTTRQQQGQNARAITIYSQQVSAHANLRHVLALRRQVHRLLTEQG